ncbi:prenyltransferase [bacterium]|nr:prenyltransferase [candidate division CSSED10-310 bacterium]
MQKRSILKSAIAVTRPRFLLLVPACVLAGTATAAMELDAVPWFRVLVVLFGAIAAHMSVNALNEYQDFRSGLDMKTRRTPFSGGTGTLPAHPEAAFAALITGIVCLFIAGAVGVYVSVVTGWKVWIPAVAGTLTIVFYTGQINRNPFLCLIAPGIGFGSCMVLGTHYALAGSFSPPAWLISMIPFFQVSNLLLLNQFPDVDADRSIGRRHFPIVIGRKKSAVIYLAFSLGAFAVIIAGSVFAVLPPGALAGLFMLVFAVPMHIGVFRHADDVDRLQPFMGMNVLVTILTPALTAVGMLITVSHS